MPGFQSLEPCGQIMDPGSTLSGGWKAEDIQKPESGVGVDQQGGAHVGEDHELSTGAQLKGVDEE